MTEFKSLCGTCPQEVSRFIYSRLLKKGEITLPCGHSANVQNIYAPMADDWKKFKEIRLVKNEFWHILSYDDSLETSMGEGADDNEFLTARGSAGAWDTYWSGAVAAEAAKGELPTDTLYLYTVKAFRIMDFSPSISQFAERPFDTHEYEGIRFSDKSFDPCSLGIKTKAPYMRFIRKEVVTEADAPADSIYNLS